MCVCGVCVKLHINQVEHSDVNQRGLILVLSKIVII